MSREALRLYWRIMREIDWANRPMQLFLFLNVMQ